MGIARITNCFYFLLRKVMKERESFVTTNIFRLCFLNSVCFERTDAGMQLSHRLFER